MKNLRWDSHLTVKFVKLYLSKGCLWNRDHADFKHGKSKEKAYQEIVDEMRKHIEIDINGVKTKIKCLRSTYSQEVAKVCKRSTDPNNIYESSLPWFKEMDKYLKRKNSTFYRQRPEHKWGLDKDSYYPEEHLDEEFLENIREVGEITDNEPQEEYSKIYTDTIRSKWSSEVTTEFVKCYLKHECLWNPKDPDRTDQEMRSIAYKDIIYNMRKYVKMDEFGIKTKVRNLRSTYHQELLKIMRKSKDPNHMYEPALSWFKLMDEKLRNVVQLRSKLIAPDGQWDAQWDHDKTTDKTLIDEELLRNIKTDLDCNEGNDAINDDCNEDNDAMNDDCNEDNDAMNDDCNEDNYGMDDDSKDDVTNDEDPMEHEESSKDILFIEPSTTKDASLFEDEYDIFGKYVAAQLRRLDLKPALQAKADILNVLSKARIDALGT